ncbi:MAG: ankyrin repeat domain-containing protein, partial [Deltaproteobacteria bacterium]
MRGHLTYLALFVILLICQISVCLAAETPDPNESTKYLDAVRMFADNVLKYGRDTYGPKHTPLFVDGLMVRDPNDPNYGKDGVFKPVEWIAPNGERWILSNLASQQNLFRTLDGLTKITGDPKYKQAAMDAIKYAFDNLRSPNGLLYWGLQDAYDAQRDIIYISGDHSLKSYYPYYELMWEVDAEALRKFVEAFWSAHIINWSNLDMNRVARSFNTTFEEPWIQEYTGGPVFFQSQGRSFLNTGSDLFYAAGILTKLSGDKKPLIWAKRLNYRYVQTRNPRVGISGYVYTRKEPDGVWLQFGEDFEGHLVLAATLVPLPPGLGNPDIREIFPGYLMVTPGIEYNPAISPWASSMLLGDNLGNDGRDFIQWGLEELTALGKVAYRQQDNVWIPMLNDGTSLEGYVCRKDGGHGWRGLEFKAIPVVAMDFWVYALAYRITGDQFMWRMARSIASGYGFGDIGITPETHSQLKIATDCWQPYTLLGFLELYKKTENRSFLQIAQNIGDKLLARRFHKGFFVPSDKHIYTKFDAIEPLALLHLYISLKASSTAIPIVWPARSYFNVPYRHHQNISIDNSLIYTLTNSLEPPKSLHEVAIEGDLDRVKAMLAGGANVNAWDQLNASALHYACQQGNIEVAELLIAKGARVDAGRATPLHYAVEKGHKEVVELLIAKGANVNATRGYPAEGDTPLHSAARGGHKEIVELLIAKGANVNATRGYPAEGDTPLHSAARAGHKDIVELLIAKGANVNAKNNDGQKPVDVAVQRGQKEIAELLLSKSCNVSLHTAAYFGDLQRVEELIDDGVSVDAKDQRDQTALHYAAKTAQITVAKFLIANGADINAGKWTPLQEAAYHSKEIVELLLAKGANINTGEWTALHSALDA